MYRVLSFGIIILFGASLGKALSDIIFTVPNSSSSLIKLIAESNSMIKEDLPPPNPYFSVELLKMNVFYTGVKNPITIGATGVKLEDIDVEARNATIIRESDNRYTVLVNSPGIAEIIVKNTKTGKSVTKEFRVKKIPDPTAVLILGKSDGLVKSGAMRAQLGIYARLDNFDFDAKCSITSYKLVYVSKRADPVELQGKGGKFRDKILFVIKNARPGNSY
ncbi:MAG: hypothetical protein MK212_20775, partial [Saprospiraceae bacterium]|nr:hypothetical protein [Saprospiraceae bacterium]